MITFYVKRTFIHLKGPYNVVALFLSRHLSGCLVSILSQEPMSLVPQKRHGDTFITRRSPFLPTLWHPFSDMAMEECQRLRATEMTTDHQAHAGSYSRNRFSF